MEVIILKTQNSSFVDKQNIYKIDSKLRNWGTILNIMIFQHVERVFRRWQEIVLRKMQYNVIKFYEGKIASSHIIIA